MSYILNIYVSSLTETNSLLLKNETRVRLHFVLSSSAENAVALAKNDIDEAISTILKTNFGKEIHNTPNPKSVLRRGSQSRVDFDFIV